MLKRVKIYAVNISAVLLVCFLYRRITDLPVLLPLTDGSILSVEIFYGATVLASQDRSKIDEERRQMEHTPMHYERGYELNTWHGRTGRSRAHAHTTHTPMRVDKMTTSWTGPDCAVCETINTYIQITPNKRTTTLGPVAAKYNWHDQAGMRACVHFNIFTFKHLMIVVFSFLTVVPSTLRISKTLQLSVLKM